MSAASDRLAQLESQEANLSSVTAKTVVPVSPALDRLNKLESLQVKTPAQDSNLFESIKEGVTGSQRQAALPEDVQQLPELGSLTSPVSTGEFGSDIQIAAGLLTSFDPKARMDIIRDAVPGVEFEQVNDTTVVKLPNGQQAVLNAPGLSQSDIVSGIAQVLAFSPAGRIGALGRNLAQRVGLGAVTSGATEAALQGASKALGSEQEIDKGQISTAAILGGGAEVVAPAIQAVRQARINRQGQLQKEAGDIAKEGIEASEQTGIKLFSAQLTDDAADLERQSFVGKLSSGAKIAAQQLNKQNEEVGKAFENLLSSIAPPEAIIRGEKRIRSAAQESIALRKKIRAEKSSPFYNEAFKENATVNTDPVISLINKKLGTLAKDSRSAVALRKVKGLVEQSTIKQKKGRVGIETIEELKIPKINKLHSTKLEIDDMLDKFAEAPLGRTAKRHIKEVQVSLLDEMDTASDLYRQGRKKFEVNSPAVNEIEDSIIGTIAGLDDTQLKTTSAKLFDAAQTNPEMVKQAKKMIEEVDPDAWNDIIRVEMQKRLGRIKSDPDAALSEENLPSQMFNAIFGNFRNRKVLFDGAGPNTDVGKNLKFFETALKRASRGRPGGSQTATREEIKSELKAGVGDFFREFVATPIKKAVAIGEDTFFQKRVRNLAESLFNPEWRPQMKKIRKLNPSGNEWQRSMMQLLNDIDNQESSGDVKSSK